MSMPQGVDFRSSAAFVTDAASTTFEHDPANANPGSIGSATYPTTSPQGNNVGWETISAASVSTRDRSAAVDARLAGSQFIGSGALTQSTYRIDIPNAGSYNIRLASGDQHYNVAQGYLEIFDGTSSLGVVVNGLATAGGGEFFDASGTKRTTVSDWTTNNTLRAILMTGTIFRVKIGDNGSNAGFINHIWIESGNAPIVRYYYDMIGAAHNV